MAEVPREEFVPPELHHAAYDDGPLPIGGGQTISQPYIVAAMIAQLELEPTARVLEVGAGSGYAAAVMGRIAAEVIAVERHRELARSAQHRLERLGYTNIRILHRDGTLGCPEEAPFDAIIVAAAAPDVPESLRDQLEVGGRMVIPVGQSRMTQQLIRVTKTGPDSFDEETLDPVRFVALVGEQGWPESAD
jgi:protein-L-isoaspartate(D-aspartate) O-methyltransferase